MMTPNKIAAPAAPAYNRSFGQSIAEAGAIAPAVETGLVPFAFEMALVSEPVELSVTENGPEIVGT